MDDGSGDGDKEKSEGIWETMKNGIIGFSDSSAIRGETGFYDFQICLNNWRAICSIHQEKVHRK